METMLVIVVILLVVAVLSLQIRLLQKKTDPPLDLAPLNARTEAIERAQERTERGLREEISRNREEADRESNALRQATQAALATFSGGLRDEIGGMSSSQKAQLEVFGAQLGELNRAVDEKLGSLRATLETRLQVFNDSLLQALNDLNRLNREDSDSVVHQLGAIRDTLDQRLAAVAAENQGKLDQIRAELLAATQHMRTEISENLKGFNDSVVNSITGIAAAQSAELARLTEATNQKLEAVRGTVQERLKTLQDENTLKLEQIRHTVDEQLQSTLEKRLGESFKIVSERLEQVHRGLGEMQTLAAGVGDLKKLLSNVRARGTWGEVQLGMLLEQMLTPDQYGTNVATTGTGERVEFAIKLPGAEPEGCVWLPIDAKFPKEDYDRLLEAVDRADAGAIEESSHQLENRARQCARDISQKYLAPPKTTDFAIMYLPTEGLYAEVLRRPGLIEMLQREHRVTVAGPMTLSAILNSLQMGFRTLAIQKRSSEVWEVLGAVKTEFGKYSKVLETVQKKLQEANNTVETGLTRTRVIQRKLKNIEELPTSATEVSIPMDAEETVLEAVGAGAGDD
jgi:DNA recombination protein RmuC